MIGGHDKAVTRLRVHHAEMHSLRCEGIKVGFMNDVDDHYLNVVKLLCHRKAVALGEQCNFSKTKVNGK